MTEHDQDLPLGEAPAVIEAPRHIGRLLRPREQRRIEAAGHLEADTELLSALVGLQRTLDAVAQLVVSQQRRVLWSGTALIGATGIWHRRVPGGSKSIAVTNYTGNSLVTVASAAPSGAAPGPGAGTHNVPAGVFATFNNDTADWTLYGTAGQAVHVEIFSVPVNPVASGDI